MENIFEVFNKGSKKEPENIIKSVPLTDAQLMIHKKGVLNLLKNIVPDFVIDNNNKPVIAQLFGYFTGNVEVCEALNINLNKGILFCGNIGTGKSIIMNAFKQYTGQILIKNSFQYFTAEKIIDDVNVTGVESLRIFNENFTGYKVYPITCYIDDICSKNEKVKNYGTEVSVIEQLISIRYNIFSRYKKLTHFSTNIFPADMSKFYDARIIDRLIEMCNIIELTGESRRK